MEFNDFELAMRMRSCNNEKFKSLVLMHLSFEFELNTDDFEQPCHEFIYEEKGKLKRWSRLSKKHKQGHCGTSSVTASCTSATTSKSVGNSPTESLEQQIDPGFLRHLQDLKDFLMLEKNLIQEGLFRKTGAVSRQNELRLHIQQDKPLNLEEAEFSAHDCATVFKSFLAELPEPLLTDAHYAAHMQIAPLCQALVGKANTVAERQQHLLNSVQLLLLLLPDENRELMQHIIEMLHEVAERESCNKMTAENLATLFTPHLICPRNLPPEVLHYTAKRLSSIIAYMIIRGLEIFSVPAKLATDIRAYFLECKRKKTMSPEQTLDESISDVSTVNTVYTFVDRAATAAATNTNTTDTELAQLYAHIQSLPESSKKRRLIKQFNKQNGQGTPLQLVLMNRLKNNEATRSAKSLGDSIKKHIFHKSLMSRTPKRAPPVLSMGNETPNMANAKPPKLRVLFQSPSVSCTVTTKTAINTTTNTLHTLKKSISSTSLKTESATNSTDSSSDSQHASYCISAPVSRQQSEELSNKPSADDLDDADTCCITPLKLMSAAAKQLITVGDKKSVAWDEQRLLEIAEYDYSNACTPIQQPSRYKSEPNLCSMLPQTIPDDHNTVDDALTPILENSTTSVGKSLTRKLMKGVSMGNLRFPFSTPETTKRLVRSVSATLKRCSSEVDAPSSMVDAPLLENMDDTDEDETDGNDNQDVDDDSSTELPVGIGIGISFPQFLHRNNYRNRSMSPISKSTQRMPKAMQESIMTPRSRKPVIMVNALGIGEVKSQFETENEIDPLIPFKQVEPPVLHSENATSLDGFPNIFTGTEPSSIDCINMESNSNSNSNSNEPMMPEKSHKNDALSNDFKEYLLTRSVLTASPTDLSFTSRSDDFGGASTTQDIEDFDESELSASLLYCLDGNEPIVASGSINRESSWAALSSLGNSNNTRKRAACADTSGTSYKTPTHHFEGNSSDDGDDKENRQKDHFHNKKLLITSHEEYPGETAL